jgi:hypothetical protein
VAVAFVDQGYIGERPADDAAEYGTRLEVVKLPEARHGFARALERALGVSFRA